MKELLSDRWLAREDARMLLAKLRLSEGAPIETVLDRLMSITARALRVERVGIWEIDEKDSGLRCMYVRDDRGGATGRGIFLPIADLGAYERAMRERRVIAADDVGSHPFTRAMDDVYFHHYEVRATLDVPVYRNGRVVGVVCHEHRGSPRTWAEGDIDFAISVAEAIALVYATNELHLADTNLREIEQDFHDALHAGEVGAVVRGVAHDVNNLLSALGLRAGLTRRYARDPDAVNEGLDRIIELVNHAARLMQHLMQHTRSVPSRPEAVSIDQVLERTRGMLRSLAGEERVVLFEFNATGALVWIDPVQLEQVVSNLVVNARDATRPGGVIRVSTSLRNTAEFAHVELTVEDDGHGMPESVRRRIFEPFYSTREGTTHRGLGLSTVRSIVEQAQGWIDVESTPDHGTRFVISLPRHETVLPSRAPESTA